MRFGAVVEKDTVIRAQRMVYNKVVKIIMLHSKSQHFLFFLSIQSFSLVVNENLREV